MPQLIRTQTIPKDGEIVVRLQIDLNINVSGADNVSCGRVQADTQKDPPKENDEPEWLVPTFTSGPKINFGKKQDKN